MFTRGYTKHGLAIPMTNMLYKNLTCFYQVMLGTPYLCCHSIKATMCVLFQWCLNIKNGATMDEHINPFINHYIESLFFFKHYVWEPHGTPIFGCMFFLIPSINMVVITPIDRASKGGNGGIKA